MLVLVRSREEDGDMLCSVWVRLFSPSLALRFLTLFTLGMPSGRAVHGAVGDVALH